EVVLLDVLAVVALAVGETEQALFQDGIDAVPQGQGEAEILPIVGDSRQAVLPPAVRTRPRLVVTEVAPGVAAFAVILANGAPLALGEIGAPLLPRRPGPTGLLETASFFCHGQTPAWWRRGFTARRAQHRMSCPRCRLPVQIAAMGRRSDAA